MRYTRDVVTVGLIIGMLLSMSALAMAQGMVTPSVTVSDQPIVDGKVTISEVVSDGPGWVVIHIQKDGKPGPVIGQSPVVDGVNKDVVVEIDASMATEVLYAMLHVDAGEMGKYEFPGADVPVKVGDKVVVSPFNVVEEMAMAAVTPAIDVEDQEVMDDAVVVSSVTAAEPGWVVIHIEADGKPGPVIGWTAVPAGESRDVRVTIDVQRATPRLFAMLHVDRGTAGVYEFPGADVPVKVDEKVVVKPFKAMIGPMPAGMAVPGAFLAPELAALLAALLAGLLLIGGVGLALARRAR